MGKKLLIIICLLIPLCLYGLCAQLFAQASPPESTTDDTVDSADKPEDTTSDKDDTPAEDSSKENEKTEEIKLRPVIIKGDKEKRKKKDIQDISRHTMTVQDLKRVPASFNDALSALTALPGIMKTSGFIFGQLVIRGADVTTNNYYVDDIPLFDPMHFGGLHSVINTNFMDEIDIYSSCFPAKFGSATSAIININTIDEVKEFEGYADIGIISVSALAKSPILKDKNSNLIFNPFTNPGKDDGYENAGYMIASARYGYLKFAVDIMEYFIDEEDQTTTFDFEYWDYQAKSKYKLNNSHSITLFFMGHKDFFKVSATGQDDDNRGDPDENDPIYEDARIRFNFEVSTHNQAIYYNYTPSKKINNRLYFYSNLNERFRYYDVQSEEIADWLKDFKNRSRPYTFALHDKLEYRWLDGHAKLRLGLGQTYYMFKAKAREVLPYGNSEWVDPSDPDAVYAYEIDEKIENHVTSGYIENKFSIYGFSTLLGVRSDYLKRAETATFDPRILVSYKFDTDTTLSAAGGKYSYFFQTNPFIFHDVPDVCKLGKEVPPEKAWHSSLGVEQGLPDDTTIKIEGFYNYFYDKPAAYAHHEPDGTFRQGLTTRKLKAYGFEILLKKDIRQDKDGLFCWLSYTYTRSREKSGLPTEEGYLGVPENRVGDKYGDVWINSDFELRHVLKVIGGYTLGKHTFSGKLQLYAWQHYTPIIGSEEDTEYAAENPGLFRYTPVYGQKNSRRHPLNYNLDLRYSYKVKYSWGYLSWYVEALFIQYVDKIVDTTKTYENWDFGQPYQKGVNPSTVDEEESPLPFIPNFGVEIKF